MSEQIDSIRINEATKSALIDLNNTIKELQSRVQLIGVTYLDALGKKPEEYQISQDLNSFIKISESKME